MKISYEKLRKILSCGFETGFFYKERCFDICRCCLDQSERIDLSNLDNRRIVIDDFTYQGWALREDNILESEQIFYNSDDLLDNAIIDGKLLSDIWNDDELIY